MEISRKEVTIEDKRLIDEVFIIYQSNPEYFRLAGTEKISVKDVLDDIKAVPPEISKDKKHFFLYSDSEGPVAVLDIVYGYPDEDTCFIGLLIVYGRYHRMGYGKVLYESLEDEAIKRGFGRIRLGVISNNSKGKSFWEKMGFTRIRTVISNIRPEKEWEVHIMEKTLRP